MANGKSRYRRKIGRKYYNLKRNPRGSYVFGKDEANQKIKALRQKGQVAVKRRAYSPENEPVGWFVWSRKSQKRKARRQKGRR